MTIPRPPISQVHFFETFSNCDLTEMVDSARIPFATLIGGKLVVGLSIRNGMLAGLYGMAASS